MKKHSKKIGAALLVLAVFMVVIGFKNLNKANSKTNPVNQAEYDKLLNRAMPSFAAAVVLFMIGAMMTFSPKHEEALA